jgi:hypothetical protein
MSPPDFKTMITIQIAQAMITAFLASSAPKPTLARSPARAAVTDSKVRGIRAGAPKLVSAYRAWYGARHFGDLTPMRSAA